jgi:DNA-binding response OmpR family regulator
MSYHGTARSLRNCCRNRKDQCLKTILIVDDQATIRCLLEISLRAKNRNILLAASGEQALEMARENKLDLVIMDLMMPGGMDGFETIECLRSDAAAAACPILILTAKDQQAERMRAVEMNVDDYLAKPFKLEDLFERVNRLLEQEQPAGRY